MQSVQELVDLIYDQVFIHPVRHELIWLPINDLGLNWEQIVFPTSCSIIAMPFSKGYPDAYSKYGDAKIIGCEWGHKLRLMDFYWSIKKETPGITLRNVVECIYRVIGSLERHPQLKIIEVPYSGEIQIFIEWPVLNKILESIK